MGKTLREKYNEIRKKITVIEEILKILESGEIQ